MERHFDEELNELKAQILQMGAIAEEMIQKAVKALIERRDALTEEVFALENTVNQMHVAIDDRCLKLIARHQPMAVDLRLITVAMKINGDLERIADQAVNIGQTCHFHLLKETPVPEMSLLTRMADISQKMLRESLDAFSRRDVELAKTVLAQDEEEDQLKTHALTRLIERLKMDPEKSSQYVDLILVSRNMERIGDHATNIAEDVIFMTVGQDIRHPLSNS